MAGNSYPHIVFAKDADVLPHATLAEVLSEEFPGAEVEQGEISTVLRLSDYAVTFWYDDEAEGLGDRYADYAAPIRRKRITRCTTMIDASGSDDPDRTHEADVRRLMTTLAERDGVYVFSEETKRFLAMDYDDAVSPAAGTTTAVAGSDAMSGAAQIPPEQFVQPTTTQPELDPRSGVSAPPHVAPEVSEVALGAEELDPSYAHSEYRPVDRPTDGVAAEYERTHPEHARHEQPVPATGHDDARRVDLRTDDRPADVPRDDLHAGDGRNTDVTAGHSQTGAPGTQAPVAGAPVAGPDPETGVGGAHVATPHPEPRPEPVSPASTGAPVSPSESQPAPAADSPAAPGRPVEPHHGAPEAQDKPGLFKRLFGRKH